MILKADLVSKTSYLTESIADLKAGVAADIGHINTKSIVTGYQPDADGLKQALTGAEIVLIPAGVPRKPGMTRDGKLPRPKPIMLGLSVSLTSSDILYLQTSSIPMPPSSATSPKPLQTPPPTPTSS